MTDPSTTPEPARRVHSSPRWPYVLVAAFLAIGLLVVVAWPVRLPYYAMSPGPVENVSNLVTIDGAPRYDSQGTFYLLTVSLRGEVNPFEWFEAKYVDSRVDLVSSDLIRPPGVTQEQITRSNQDAMNESIDSAIYVALNRLGYQVTFDGDGVKVLDVVAGSPAEGAFQVDDIITAVQGTAVHTVDEASARIKEYKPGDTITLSGTRNDEPFEATVTLVEHPDIPGAAMVGVVLDTVGLRLDLPIDVNVDPGNIGGPSAGLEFTLTLLDLLTPGDLTKGHVLAGTGTIRFDETVGAIGGVRQKVFGARSIGAEAIFVPRDNYADALTAAGDAIVVVPVDTLQDALDYLDSLQPAPAMVAAPSVP
jgi:PDZ domain-containing protein